MLSFATSIPLSFNRGRSLSFFFFFLTKSSRYPTIVYTLAHDRWYVYICRNACCCAGGGPCFHPRARYRATLATWRSQREEIGRRYRMAHRVYIRRMEKTVRLVVRRLSWLYTVSQTRVLDTALGKGRCVSVLLWEKETLKEVEATKQSLIYPTCDLFIDDCAISCNWRDISAVIFCHDISCRVVQWYLSFRKKIVFVW